MAELYELEPAFPGDSEIDQIHRVFQFLGRPTMETWPEGCMLAKQANMEWPASMSVGILHDICVAAEAIRKVGAPKVTQSPRAPPLKVSSIERLSGISKEEPASRHALGLFCGMIEINPERRLTAHGALQHWYFSDSPETATSAGIFQNSSVTATKSISPKSVAEEPYLQLARMDTSISPRFLSSRVTTESSKYQQEDVDVFFSP